MATREHMIAAIKGDRRTLQGESTASLTLSFAAITHKPKATKVTVSKAPKSIEASMDRGRMIIALVKLNGATSKESIKAQYREFAGWTTASLKASLDANEPKADNTVVVSPIMEEWTKSVSDEVTMQDMLENIRLAFLEGRHHYGNELIQAAKEAC